MKRIQNLSYPLWVGRTMSLFDQFVHVFWWETEACEPNAPQTCKVKTKEEAFEFVQRAEAKGVLAYASAPIPAYGGQQGVFVFSAAKEGISLMKSKDFVKVTTARNSLFQMTDQMADAFQKTPKKTVAKQPEKVAKGDKTDPAVMLVDVVFDKTYLAMPLLEIRKIEQEENKTILYTFRTRAQIFHAEQKTAHLKSGDYKPVWVYGGSYVKFTSQLKHPLTWYCDVLDYVLERDVSLERMDEPAFPDYEEDIDGLKAMQEAFVPACDYVAKQPETPYDGENFDIDEPDEPELPE